MDIKQKTAGPYAETKAWLSRAMTIEREVRALLRARREMYELATSAVGQYGGTPVKTSGGTRPVERLAELDNKIDKTIDRLADTKSEILAVIQRVPDGTLRTLLIERYIKGRSWGEVANTLGRSIPMTKIKLHARALKALENNLNHNI